MPVPFPRRRLPRGWTWSLMTAFSDTGMTGPSSRAAPSKSVRFYVRRMHRRLTLVCCWLSSGTRTIHCFMFIVSL